MGAKLEKLFGNGWFWAVFVLAGFAVWLTPILREGPFSGPDVLGTAGCFAGLDQLDRDFGSNDLAGRVWVATSCTGDCVSGSVDKLQALQRRFRRFKGRLYLVTFVDRGSAPNSDLAANNASNPRLWRFLDGTESDWSQLFAGVTQRVPRTDLALVDHKGKVRGVYPPTDDAIKTLLKDVTKIVGLEMEKDPALTSDPVEITNCRPSSTAKTHATKEPAR